MNKTKDPGDYLETNGLVDGDIPSGEPCPFHVECQAIQPNCPTPTHILPHKFSCALARLRSLLKCKDQKNT